METLCAEVRKALSRSGFHERAGIFPGFEAREVGAGRVAVYHHGLSSQQERVAIKVVYKMVLDRFFFQTEMQGINLYVLGIADRVALFDAFLDDLQARYPNVRSWVAIDAREVKSWSLDSNDNLTIEYGEHIWHDNLLLRSRDESSC